MSIGATPSNKKIVILDSGVGGLTITRAIIEQLPSVDIHYMADDEAFPYGNWQEEDLIQRISQILMTACSKIAPDAIVVACNTASSRVLPSLRAKFQIPVVGTVPAIKPAALITQSQMVSVVATAGTANSPYLRNLINQFASDINVSIIETHNLARLAEEHFSGLPIDLNLLAEEIHPAFVETHDKRTDTIVLGCTHYPLLLDKLQALAPWPVTWLDPANAVAKQLSRVLYPSLLNWEPKPFPRKMSFAYTSGNTLPDFQVRMKELCTDNIGPYDAHIRKEASL